MTSVCLVSDKDFSDAMNNSNTWRVMGAGFFLAILINLPFYSWVFNEHWGWVEGFPLGWLGTGLDYMATFFHEIGHTVFAWFFGYLTLPSFDLQHGGGMAWSMGGQQIWILGLVYAAIGYGLYVFRDYRFLQISLLFLLAFNLSMAFNSGHENIIDFMGPAFEPLIAAFFLYRALFDLAPRGGFERFLNALFGFAIIFKVFIDASGLLTNEIHRLLYYQQKGAFGFGDFDKVADRLAFFNFTGVVSVWILLTVLCLLTPFVLYLFSSQKKL